MGTDYLGNVVTGDDPAVCAAIDDFVGGLLAYETRAAGIVAVADAHPDHGLANIYAGLLHMLAEAPGTDAAARPHLDRAMRVADTLTPRERALADVLRLWMADDIDAVEAGLDAILADHPRDLAALKLLHYNQFNHGAFAAMLRAALRSAAAAPEVPQVHGMVAFGYEQCHLLDDAEAAARHALSLAPDGREPWAQHALAHVMLTRGRIDEGAAFLEDARPLWTDLNSFMVTHLWWHLALFYLSQGRDAEALAIYDEHAWTFAKDYSQDQIGAVSLLARYEMAGIDVGDRWTDVGTYLAARAEDVGQPFLSVQYLYGLARAGLPEADRLMAAIEAVAADGPARTRLAWTSAGLPLARGVLAQARGDHDAAADALETALPHLVRIGGSHAQRDLFDQLLLAARIAASRLDEAQQMLEMRRGYDPDGVALNMQLAGVYTALDLPEQAAQAAGRARARRAAWA